MNWKKIIYANTDEDSTPSTTETSVKPPKDKKQVFPETATNKFPVADSVVDNLFSTQAATTKSTSPTNIMSNPDIPTKEHLDKFVEMYNNGFDGLNQDGYDFYEFFKAIFESNGVENPEMYKMAMSMGSALDKSNTQTKLIAQADFYINEITKVYNTYVNSGTTKKQDLSNQKTNETHTLTEELGNLRGQLQAIQNQITSKEGQLAAIDNKYKPMIDDIDSKLLSNDYAKNKIIASITRVKENITNFLNKK